MNDVEAELRVRLAEVGLVEPVELAGWAADMERTLGSSRPDLAWRLRAVLSDAP